MLKKTMILIITLYMCLLMNVNQISADQNILPIIKTKVVEPPKIKHKPAKKKPKLIKKKPLSIKKKVVVTKSKVIVKVTPKKVVTKKVVYKKIRHRRISKSRARKVYTRKSSNTGKINIILSFYTSSVNNCGNSAGIGASGKSLTSGDCAAPSNVSFNTQIQTSAGYTLRVEDRGSAIRYTYINGKRYMKVDVFVPGASQQELLNKGTIKTTGYIISK